jgi:lipopolysaccharide export system protein LptA
MRPGTLSLIATAAALLLCAPAQAQFGSNGAPIELAADSIEGMESQNVILLVGRVNVRQGEARLAADEMQIFLKPDSEREIDRIEADGSVIYITPAEVARGDRGIYVATSERITLTGNVTLVRGDSTLAGEELVIESSTGRSSLTRQTGGGSGGRVRGVVSSADAQAVNTSSESAEDQP